MKGNSLSTSSNIFSSDSESDSSVEELVPLAASDASELDSSDSELSDVLSGDEGVAFGPHLPDQGPLDLKGGFSGFFALEDASRTRLDGEYHGGRKKVRYPRSVKKAMRAHSRAPTSDEQRVDTPRAPPPDEPSPSSAEAPPAPIPIPVLIPMNHAPHTPPVHDVSVTQEAKTEVDLTSEGSNFYNHITLARKQGDVANKFRAYFSILTLRDHLIGEGIPVSPAALGEILPFSNLIRDSSSVSLSPLSLEESLRTFPELPSGWAIRGHDCFLRSVLDIYAKATSFDSEGGAISSSIMDIYVTLVESVATNHSIFPPGPTPLRPEGTSPMMHDFIEVDTSSPKRADFKAVEDYGDLKGCIRLAIDYVKAYNASDNRRRFAPLDSYINASRTTSQLSQKMGIINFFLNLRSRWKSAEDILSTLSFPRDGHHDLELTMHKFVSDIFNLWGLASLLGYVGRENSMAFQASIKEKFRAFADSFPPEPRLEIKKRLCMDSFTDPKFNLSLYLCSLAYTSSREKEYMNSTQWCFLESLFCPAPSKRPVIPLDGSFFTAKGFFKSDKMSSYSQLAGSKRTQSSTTTGPTVSSVTAAQPSKKKQKGSKKSSSSSSSSPSTTTPSSSNSTPPSTTPSSTTPSSSTPSSSSSPLSSTQYSILASAPVPSDSQLLIIRACKNRKEYLNYLISRGLDPKRALGRCFSCASRDHVSSVCVTQMPISFYPFKEDEIKMLSSQ